MALSVLYIGGTGQISLPCVDASVAAGHRVTVLNRGQTSVPLPDGVETVVGEVGDGAGYANLRDRHFDVVCQFRVYTPEQMQEDIATFAGRTGQYVFISSASAYQKPARHYVITEKTPVENPHWLYSHEKAVCEQMLHAQDSMPWTIVRPSHTVRTKIPLAIGDGDANARRLLRGAPIVVHGDGMSLWALTRSVDFSVPFVRLFGNRQAIGEDFHITNDRSFTWDEITHAIAAGLGVEAKIVHVPTETLIRYRPDWEGPLLGDKSWPVLFDNTKVKTVAGDFTCASDLSTILEESIASFTARNVAAAQQPHELDPLFDRICAEQSALGG